MTARPGEIVNPEDIIKMLRAFADPVLTELGLSVAQIEAQALPELEISSTIIRNAILRPKAFGTLHLRIAADVGLVVTNVKSESNFEMTILPILLEREKLILRRIQALEELHRLQDLKDVINLIKDETVRVRMQSELDALREKAAHYDQELKTKRPVVFIGSSTEGLQIAEMIQINLQYGCDCVIWSQGVFGLSEGTLESLVRSAANFDFAILVLTPDDLVSKHDTQSSQPRDNVLFGLGLFMGKFGRERTFIVHGHGIELRLPTDLAGIQPATFAQRSDNNLRAALGPVCTLLKGAMGVR